MKYGISRVELKVKTLFIFLLTILRFILFGRALHKREQVKKIIIFQGGKLGDMVCTTPMFRAVKRQYPQCSVVVIGSAVNKIILEHNPDVYEYIVHEENEFFKIIKKIRKTKSDFGCITAPSPMGLAILYLSGIPLIAAPIIKGGWSPFATKTYKMMCNFVVTKDYIMGEYLPREYLKLLEPIDIHTDLTKKYVFWSTEADAKIDALVSNIDKGRTMRIGIMPGAGNKVKQWPAERFARIADYLTQKYKAQIFIIGHAANKEEIDTMLASVTSKEYVQDCSSFSLDEQKALISKLNMTVSVDTGPIFIAEACGVPTIDIGGVIHPNDMAPNDGIFHILITYDGEPLLWSMNSRVYDFRKARAGVESITVETVIEKIDELVERIKLK